MRSAQLAVCGHASCPLTRRSKRTELPCHSFCKRRKSCATATSPFNYSLTGSLLSIGLPLGLQCNKECVVQPHRSHLRLVARAWHTPRGRPLRSYRYRRALSVWQTRRSLHGLLRQVSFVFRFFSSVGFATLRQALRKPVSVLPVNKALKSDQRDVVMAFAKSAKATPTSFGALARR